MLTFHAAWRTFRRAALISARLSAIHPWMSRRVESVLPGDSSRIEVAARRVHSPMVARLRFNPRREPSLNEADSGAVRRECGRLRYDTLFGMSSHQRFDIMIGT